jgi:NAD(P)-dependent dehydrogenase (short-subunit alcohol dehydrogenase family)
VHRKLLITGAAGGMGRACARLLGATHDLILTDVTAPALDGFAAELAVEGYAIAGCQAGDVGDDALLEALVGHLADGEPFGLVHTAGLSPSMADWRRVMDVNLVATEKLLRAIEPRLVPGSVAVLIASAAGYVPSGVPDASAILADPLAPDFIARIGGEIERLANGNAVAASGLSYLLSKLGVLEMVERRGHRWGAKGARIASISPGLILTPMGRRELDFLPAAGDMDQAVSVGRSGRAMDIALAARFLLSDEASFITGSDLKVDGGSIAVTKAMMAG